MTEHREEPHSAQQEPPKESDILQAYRQVLGSLFTATLILVGLIVVILLIFDWRYFREGAQAKDPSILIFVVLSGSLGAFFSALMRLYDLEDLPKAILRRDLKGLENRYLVMYSLIPPIVGSIGAAVLYVAFAAGLIQGDIFPKFDCNEATKACKNFATLIEHYGPVGAKEHAKALVWGFIAGFSERFVPDTLLKMTKS